MKPLAHPTEAVLADYVGGALRSAFATVVATHLEACAQCREDVRALEMAAGELVHDLPPTAMGQDALARAMAGIERPLQPHAPNLRSTVDRISFGRTLWLAPGMSVRKARTGHAGDLLYLLRLPAGIQTIPHGHAGIEFTTVLKGAFRDDGETFAQGDFAEMTDEAVHRPEVLADGECICLIASEKPMRVRTFLGHLIQRLAKV